MGLFSGESYFSIICSFFPRTLDVSSIPFFVDFLPKKKKINPNCKVCIPRLLKKIFLSLVWWSIHLILALGKQKQANKFQVSLVYTCVPGQTCVHMSSRTARVT